MSGGDTVTLTAAQLEALLRDAYTAGWARTGPVWHAEARGGPWGWTDGAGHLWERQREADLCALIKARGVY